MVCLIFAAIPSGLPFGFPSLCNVLSGSDSRSWMCTRRQVSLQSTRVTLFLELISIVLDDNCDGRLTYRRIRSRSSRKLEDSEARSSDLCEDGFGRFCLRFASRGSLCELFERQLASPLFRLALLQWRLVRFQGVVLIFGVAYVG